MRAFACTCGARVYFENDRCLSCGRPLAFDIGTRTLRPVQAGDTHCSNRAALATCNWLAPPGQAFCKACALNDVVPDLSDQRRLRLYYEVEKAKRRLLYTLDALGLSVSSRADSEHGLSFCILADARLDGAEIDVPAHEAVITGHAAGRITINLLEADPPLRERMRQAMNEPYRTLLGHVRHESGHYYWQRLVAGNVAGDGKVADSTALAPSSWGTQGRHAGSCMAPCREHSKDSARLEDFRATFGDDRAPYAERLAAYYEVGPRTDWHHDFVTAYATSHPLEDFAETWAHYLHMVDTLETAAADGIALAGTPINDPFVGQPALAELLADWRQLTTSLNNLNRSLGHHDAYPFNMAPGIVPKLDYVHRLVAGQPPRARPQG